MIWTNRNYLHLLSAQILSLIGTGVSSIGLALLAWDLAGEDASLVLSIAFALKMLAYVGLAPVFGALAPHLAKKRIMVILDMVRASTILCMPFVSQIWQIYLLMFLVNACSAGFTPLFQSSLPEILPNKEEYTKALSLSRLAYDLEQIVSPILAAVLLTIISYSTLFYIDSLSFVVSAFLILSCTFPKPKSINNTQLQGKWNLLKNGIHAYLKTPRLRSLWFAYLAASSASAMVIVNTVIYVHNILQGGDTETALAMAVVGLGSMLIALNLPRWLKNHQPERFSKIGLIVICIGMFIGISTPDWPGFVFMSLALGIGMSLIQTPAGIIITETQTNAATSELFAAHFSLTHFWWFFTYLGAGLTANWFGLSGAYAAMSGLCLISVTLYWLSIRGTNNETIRG